MSTVPYPHAQIYAGYGGRHTTADAAALYVPLHVAGAKRTRNAFDTESAGIGRSSVSRSRLVDTRRVGHDMAAQDPETVPQYHHHTEYDTSMHMHMPPIVHEETFHGVPVESTEHHAPVLHDVHTAEPVPEAVGYDTETPGQRNERARYNLDDRIFISQTLEECNGNQTEAMRRLRQHPGFERITTRTIRRYKESCNVTARFTGVRPHTEFEKEVLHALVSEASVESGGTGPNYSYSNIRKTAQAVAAAPHWANDVRVQSYSFSNTWIAGFLKRHGPSGSEMLADASHTV